MNENIDIYNRRYSNYSFVVERSNFLLESYNGGFSYINNKNLFRYINEKLEKFNRRLSRSYPINFFQPIVSEIKNTIFSKPVQRDGAKKEIINRFIMNATLDFKSLDQVMKDVAILGSFLTIGILVDGVDENSLISLNIKDINKVPKNIKIKNRLYPAIKIFYPDKILDYSMNNGVINWVLLDYSYTDNIDFYKSKKIKKYVLWTNEIWKSFYFDDTGKIIEEKEYKHNLGTIPFMFFNQKDINNEPVYKSLYEDIALQQRAIYNYFSLIDENFYSTIIPLLLAKMSETPLNEENKKPKEFSLIDNVLFYEDVPPTLLKTEFLDSDKILTVIDRVTKEIYRKVGKFLDTNNVYAQSGAAKLIDNEQRAHNIYNYAKQIEELENNLLKIYCLWEKTDFTEYDKSVYPNDFSVKEAAEKIAEAIQMKNLFSGNPTAEKIIKKQIFVEKYGEYATEEEMSMIDKELNESKNIFEEDQQEEKDTIENQNK